MGYGAAIAGIAMIVGTVAQALINNRNQKKASEQQKRDQMDLTRHNQRIGMENWEKTESATAQREQLKKAGLSVGMMYSKGGAGNGMGMTPAGNISKRDVSEVNLTEPITTTLQQQQMEANIANVKADTRNKTIEGDQKEGIDLATKSATLEQVKQQTENKAIEEDILEFQKKQEEITTNIAKETERDIVYQQKANASILMDKARSAYAEANVDAKTQDERIEQIRLMTQEQTAKLVIMKITGDKLSMETEETKAKISKITTEINKLESEKKNLDQKTQLEKKQMILNEIANEFLYGDTANALRIYKTISDAGMGEFGKKIMEKIGGRRKIGF